MICNNNYLADIFRVCEMKDLILVMRFQSPLVYIWGSQVVNFHLSCTSVTDDCFYFDKQTLMKCRNMPHFIWVFTVFQSTRLGVSSIQRSKHIISAAIEGADYGTVTPAVKVTTCSTAER